nr:polysaccharide pyruvyl transferase family protein [uncultured Sphaerochaeta sp.]
MRKTKYVGLLSFQDAINYGAILQLFALQSSIESLGYNVDVIDYDCKGITSQYNFVSLKSRYSKKEILKKNVSYFYHFLKKSRIHRFKAERLNLTQRYDNHSIREVLDRYSAVIVGSDQVWNPLCTQKDETYFLQFVESTRRIGYAVSLGNSENLKLYNSDVSAYISNFYAVSIREVNDLNLMLSLGAKNCVQVLDPVFLLSKEIWGRLISEVKFENYIFVYELRQNPILWNTVKNLASTEKKTVVYVSKSISRDFEVTFKRGMIALPNISVEMFLSLVYHSDLIITDSFHGAALSILFNKEFIAVKNPDKFNTNQRLESLVSTLSINSVLIDKELAKIGTKIDYKSVNKKVSNLKKISYEFLKNSLES